MKKIIEKYCENLIISYEDIISKSHKHTITDKRHVIWYMLMKKYNSKQIAAFFSTYPPAIIRGKHKIEAMIQNKDRIILYLINKIMT